MKRILLAVSGSISAYKSYDILRGLIKQGHQVRVVITAGAEKFIKADTFSYLGADAVYTASDDFNLAVNQGDILHIELRKWMDVLVIAPASANTIAKLAGGFCCDLLSSIFLANNEKQVIIFPAMNTAMYEHPILQANLDRLNNLDFVFIHPPSSGLLACEETGQGKLPPFELIVDFVDCYSRKSQPRNILITTGPTTAPLDPVRHLTNPSSGKTGYELAKYYLKQGCHVCLVYGKDSQIPVENLIHHPQLELIAAQTTSEMYEQVNKRFKESDVYISSAAISDIKFNMEGTKIKKQGQEQSLSFTWATDILKEMLQQKKNQTVVSFAAETDNLSENFSAKWHKKPVDLLVGNKVSSGTIGDAQGFGANQNEYFMVKEGDIFHQAQMTKAELAKYIFNFTESQNA